MNEIQFVDQTIRDGQQSLWGFLMTTDMMLPIAPVMDQIGYKAIAFVGGRGTVVATRYLHENIFERCRLLKEKLVKTPLRASFTTWGAFGFDVEPLAATELWIKQAVASGITEFWVCNYQNLMDKYSYLVRVAKAEGAKVVAALMYTLSPVHTDELWARKTRIMVEAGDVDAIHIEDTGGVLTPERTRTLISVVQRESKDIPIEFHVHCNTGLAPVCYVEAMKAGIKTFHTAVSPLANGPSVPSIENTIKNACRLGYSPQIDEEAVKVVSDYFRRITEEHGMKLGVPVEYDLFQYGHQVPGGMLGTMRNQLAELRQEHQFEKVLEEIGKVRQELGYPVMATPYSQFVGAQALLNVSSGERYKVVPDEVIKYALGFYGEPDGPIDPNIKDKILGKAKAKKFLGWKCPEVTIKDLRNLEPGLSDDELLLRIANPEGEFRDKLKALYGRD